MKKAINLLIGIVLLMTVFMVNAYATDATPLPTTEPTTPQYPSITVEPPTVSVESGKVAYGTHVSISPTTAHVAYSVNGGDFVYSFTGAGITVTEDTTLVVKSWVDNLIDGVKYILPEATYTYTIAEDVEESPTPAPLPEVVTLKAPTASIESGKVAYGTEVTLNATDGHFYYSINGGEIQSTLESSVTITITEDTAVTLGSWRDVVDGNTIYRSEEVTYTYTLKEELITGTVTLPDGITAPEGGMQIRIFANKHSIYCVAPSSTVNSKSYLSYRGGLSDILPKDTIEKDYKDPSLSKKGETTVTIPYGESSVDFSIVSEKITPQTSRYLSYVIENDSYVGSGIKETVTSTTDVELNIICDTASTINGTVTIPVSDTDTTFTIVAENDKEIYYNEKSGYYNNFSFFTAVKELTIPAGETSIDYSLTVRDLPDYTVYIAFDDKKYKRQTHLIDCTTDKYDIDFHSFEKSKKISGKINLPEGITSFEDFNDYVYEYLGGSVNIQSASAPYYYIDSCDFYFSAEETSATFELYDDIGVEDVIVYYLLEDSYIKDIYYGGVYADDTKCVSNKKNATTIKPDNQTISMNIIKANTVNFNLINPPDYCPDIKAIIQTDNTQLTNSEDADLVVNGLSYTDEDEFVCFLNIPEEYNYYTISAVISESTGATAYLTENGFSDEFNDSVILSSDNLSVSEEWTDYDPKYPFFVKQVGYGRDDDESIYYGNVKIANDSDFTKENVKIYTVIYDANGYQSIKESDISVAAHDMEYYNYEFSYDEYDNAKRIDLFFWDGVKPLSEKFTIKQP